MSGALSSTAWLIWGTTSFQRDDTPTSLTSCKLTAYLADIDEEATEMFDRLVNQFVKQEGVTEQLKAENQMLWVQRMNNIRNRAEDIVNNEIIYQ